MASNSSGLLPLIMPPDYYQRLGYTTIKTPIAFERWINGPVTQINNPLWPDIPKSPNVKNPANEAALDSVQVADAGDTSPWFGMGATPGTEDYVSQPYLGTSAKTRNMAISDQLMSLLNSIGQQQGVYFEVESGGQSSNHTAATYNQPGGWTGKRRHDNGQAADVRAYTLNADGSRHYLDFSNPTDQARWGQIVQAAVAGGATGIGAGEGYMGDQTVHIGFGSPAATWGAGDSSSTAPDWLVAAYRAGQKGPPSIAPTPFPAPNSALGAISGAIGEPSLSPALSAYADIGGGMPPLPTPRPKSPASFDGLDPSAFYTGANAFPSAAAVAASRQGVPVPLTADKPQADIFAPMQPTSGSPLPAPLTGSAPPAQLVDLAQDPNGLASILGEKPNTWAPFDQGASIWPPASPAPAAPASSPDVLTQLFGSPDGSRFDPTSLPPTGTILDVFGPNQAEAAPTTPPTYTPPTTSSGILPGPVTPTPFQPVPPGARPSTVPSGTPIPYSGSGNSDALYSLPAPPPSPLSSGPRVPLPYAAPAGLGAPDGLTPALRPSGSPPGGSGTSMPGAPPPMPHPRPSVPMVDIASGRTVPIGTTGTAQGGRYGYQVMDDGSVWNTTTGLMTAPPTVKTAAPSAASSSSQPNAFGQFAQNVWDHSLPGRLGAVFQGKNVDGGLLSLANKPETAVGTELSTAPPAVPAPPPTYSPPQEQPQGFDLSTYVKWLQGAFPNGVPTPPSAGPVVPGQQPSIIPTVKRSSGSSAGGGFDPVAYQNMLNQIYG